MKNEVDSLRSRLLRALLLPMLAALLTAGSGAWLLVIRPTTAAYDQALSDAAIALLPWVRSDGDALSLALPAAAERVLRTDEIDHVFFAVRSLDGMAGVGDVGLMAPPDALPAQAGMRAFTDAIHRGAPVRMMTMRASAGGREVLVIVAETTRKREQLMFDVALGLFAPLTLLALAVVLVVSRGIERGLAPMETLSRELAARSHERLDPIDEPSAVAEIRPVVHALNELLARVDSARQAQRRFIADASHQLRTPLAGLSSLLELACERAGVDDLSTRLRRLQQALSATRRTARLAQQLLALSAAEAGERDGADSTRIDLAELAAARADEWVSRALPVDIDFGFELEPAPVRANTLLLGEAIGNLVDNAIAYVPRCAHVTVRTGRDTEGAFIEIVDDGPGIPAAHRVRVTERFYRVPGSPGTGSGLGLAIVDNIAQRFGGRLELEPAQRAGFAERGLRARIRLPAAETA